MRKSTYDDLKIESDKNFTHNIIAEENDKIQKMWWALRGKSRGHASKKVLENLKFDKSGPRALGWVAIFNDSEKSQYFSK